MLIVLGAGLPLVMGKRTLQKRIRGLERQIAEHKEKIQREMRCPVPNLHVIRHWLVEVRAFREWADRARRRLENR